MAERVVDDDEWREARLNQQAQGTILARLQYELDGHLQDATVQSEQHAKYLMDPEAGVVVRTGRLEADCKALRGRMQAVESAVASRADLASRLKTIEDARAAEAQERKDARRWAWRDLLAPAIVAVVVAVLSSLLTAWAMSGQG